MSVRTLFLTRLFGLFLLVMAVWILVDQPALSAAVRALVHDRAATLLLSLICVAAGLAVVLGHQVWSGGAAPVCVTVLGWILLARGLLLLFLPADLLEALANAVAGAAWSRGAGAVTLVLGLFLTYAGFRGPPILPRGQ